MMTTKTDKDGPKGTDDAAWQAAVDTRLAALETSLAENTSITHEVRDFLTAMRGGLKVLSWLGAMAKWVSYIAGAVGAVAGAIYAIKSGGKS